MYYRLTNADFIGTSKLHRALACGNFAGIEQLPEVALVEMNDETNFRGQHALHFAVLHPEILGHMLKKCSGLDLDVKDNGGTTPLMYAAAYNIAKSLVVLLEAGADPFAFDRLNKFNAWTYSLIYGNIESLSQMLITFRLITTEDVYQAAVAYCLFTRVHLHAARWNDLDGSILRHLLAYGFGKEIFTSFGNTLLHLATNDDAPILMEHEGFPINKKNRRGITPLMTFVRYQDPVIIQTLLKQGTPVNERDLVGRTALHHLCVSTPSHGHYRMKSSLMIKNLEIAGILLCSSAQTLPGDRCVCPCSSSGCTPLRKLLTSPSGSKYQALNLATIPWLLEWYLLIFHSDRELLSRHNSELYRLQRFDELGMTHTCCAFRGSGKRYHSFFTVRTPLEDERASYHDEYCDSEPAEDIVEKAEIRNAENQLEAQLGRECDTFESLHESSRDIAWVKTLARRAVMMEEALAGTQPERNEAIRRHERWKREETKTLEVKWLVLKLMRKLSHFHSHREEKTSKFAR